MTRWFAMRRVQYNSKVNGAPFASGSNVPNAHSNFLLPTSQPPLAPRSSTHAPLLGLFGFGRMRLGGLEGRSSSLGRRVGGIAEILPAIVVYRERRKGGKI
jgi:hypothetical protein